MGNCSNKGAIGRSNGEPIRIMTDSGGVMELKGPLQVQTVVDDFPGYGVFRRDQVASPLYHHDKLLNGQSYYLLPLKKDNQKMGMGDIDMKFGTESKSARNSSVGSTTAAAAAAATATGPALEVLPSPGKGVWRVKLMIDTKELGEILSEQVNTEALIEKMRTAASSANATPKRSKGVPWGLARRPIVSSVCKLPKEGRK